MATTPPRTTARPMPALPHWETTPDDLPGRDPRGQGRRSGPASRPPGAPSRRSSPSSRQRIAERVAEIRAAPGAGRERSGPSSTTPTSRTAPSAPNAGQAAPPRLPRRARSLPPRAGPRLGRRHRRLRRGQRVLRELPRPRRRLLRQRRVQARRSTPIYWSPAQMEARQSERMATVQSLLNAQWTHESDGVTWFDPDADSLYPDRIRRRPPGADSSGLGAHCDPGTLDLWMTEATNKPSGTSSTAASRSTTRGTRPTAPPARSTPAPPCAPPSAPSRAGRRCPTWPTTRASCTPSRSPRRWPTSCSGPLLDDVAEDDMCGVTTNQVFPAIERWHPLLLEALSGIPDVQAGDSVWWHCDMIHSVAPVADQQGWGNVMYIPAAPWCDAQRAVCRRRPRGVLQRRQPERLPRGALRARVARPLRARATQRHGAPRARPGLRGPVASRQRVAVTEAVSELAGQ